MGVTLLQQLIGMFNLENSPQIINFFIVLVLGFICGRVSRWIVVKFSSIFDLPKFTRGTDKLIHKLGYSGNTIEMIADLFKWTIYILFIGIAIQVAFGEKFLTNLFVSFTTYIPKLVIAVIFLIAGFIFGDILGSIVGGLIEKSPLKSEERGIASSVSAKVTKWITVIASFIIALEVVGIHTEILTVWFGVILIAIALFVIVGTKDLALNLFAGIYLQALPDFRKGFTIEFEGRKGIIKNVGLVYTTILHGKSEVQVPNYLFMKKSFVIK